MCWYCTWQLNKRARCRWQFYLAYILHAVAQTINRRGQQRSEAPEEGGHEPQKLDPDNCNGVQHINNVFLLLENVSCKRMMGWNADSLPLPSDMIIDNSCAPSSSQAGFSGSVLCTDFVRFWLWIAERHSGSFRAVYSFSAFRGQL